MSGQSEQKKWIVAYTKEGKPYFLEIEAPTRQEAEDRAVQYLTETSQSPDCKILFIVSVC